MMLIFFTWYVAAVSKVFHPRLPFLLWFVLLVAFLQGFFSGIFFGSFVRRWRIAKRGWVGKDMVGAPEGSAT